MMIGYATRMRQDVPTCQGFDINLQQPSHPPFSTSGSEYELQNILDDLVGMGEVKPMRRLVVNLDLCLLGQCLDNICTSRGRHA